MADSVAVINYGMGNLRSVVNALTFIGAEAYVASHPRELEGADRIVLPGVGAFGDAMERLISGGWIEGLEKEVLSDGKPFMGICLGMQLLAGTSTEHGEHNGLNWIPGKVVRFPEKELVVPHIGWNDVSFRQEGGLYAGLGDSEAFYFVHSYYYVPDDDSVVTGTCIYGLEYAASLRKDNIVATQFHPEKSHKAGLAILKNFLSM
ncbi:MAG: imidazole glycerol phosphate synthase subunit HisH [Candidatus Omnitrophica bacterium]|nr:imidazole glycerol phosphate synthase subunit HisH [Candidatus Omnitrophota bacterium]MDD5488834.1 imidazole glycerol phosphate synthase subunit HisH [Candidatus Omnitrophota bacterium]